ncbi:MAG: tetratricopeptide repeat protein [Cyclobacteriaceae bacterium]|nr:tetratricopeptide repeat protein [Cyclobacteriaceae bacterium]
MNRILIIALVLLAPLSLAAQKVEQIVEAYRQKIQATINSTDVQNIYMEGDMCFNELCFPAKLYSQQPKAMRIELAFQNITFIQITNDSLTWEYNPLTKVNKLERLKSGDTGKNKKDNNTFNYASNDLANYKTLGYHVKLLEKKKLDSLETFVVELVKSAKDKSKYYINTSSYLINKIEDKEGSWFFASYKKFDAIYFPMLSQQQGSNDFIMKFKTVKLNQEFSDTLFTIPAIAYANSLKGTSKKSSFEYYFEKAEAHYDAGRADSAVAFYDKAIRLNKESEGAYNKRGLSKIDLGDYYGAIGDFNHALEINASSASAYNNRGLAKYYLNDQASAIVDYNKALQLDKTMAVTYQNRGLSYTRLEKYDEAIRDFDEIIRLKPTSGINYFNKAVCLAELEKYDEAISHYNLSLKNNYRSDEVYNYKGVSFYQLEQYDSAIQNFSTAIKANTKNLTYFENRGRSYYAKEKYKEAIADFERGLKLDDKNSGLYNMIGLSEYFMDNHKAAIKLYTKAIELNPKEAVYFDNRAAAKESLDDYVGAILDYDESIKLYPNDASVFYKRGLVKIYSSKKYEGCLDLATANEMKYEDAKEAILKNCN